MNNEIMNLNPNIFFIYLLGKINFNLRRGKLKFSSRSRVVKPSDIKDSDLNLSDHKFNN